MAWACSAWIDNLPPGLPALHEHASRVRIVLREMSHAADAFVRACEAPSFPKEHPKKSP